MSLKDIDERIVNQMIDQIIDWIDLDNEPRNNGLEDYFILVHPTQTNNIQITECFTLKMN